MISFLVLSLKLHLKKFAAKPVLWVSAAAVVVFAAAAGLIVRGDVPMIEVTAGILYDRDCPAQIRVAAAMIESVEGTPFVSFVVYDDVGALERDVALGRVDSGYVLTPRVHDALRGRPEGAITLISSPRTAAAPLLNEVVAAALLRAVALDITLDGLESLFPEHDSTAEFVAELFRLYADADIFMAPAFAGYGGRDEGGVPDLSRITAARALHGAIGLTMLALMMFSVPGFAAESGGGLKPALAVCGKLGAYYVSLWLAAAAAGLAVGAAGLTAAAFFAPMLLPDAGTLAAAIVAYAAVIAGAMAAASRFSQSSGVIRSFGLFILTAHIFFGGVLLDLAEISPELAHLQRFFPLYWYIDVVVNSI
ncbi:MAG: ABC transporter permease [Defluviitaleaceae bacterium]|nr:ABC transporter permease [Defluviitaleaceae bacterium]